MKKREEIIKKIKEEIPYVDIKPYSHNIINLQLGMLAEEYGQEEVISLIKSTRLKDLGWGYILEM